MKKRIWNNNEKAFTLMEVVIVLVILGVLSAVAIPSIGNFLTNSRVVAAEKEMMELSRAIVGEPEKDSLGFSGNMGDLPGQLQHLFSLGGASPYNPYTRTGWNGPYVDSRTNDAGDVEILFDPWNNAYRYDKAAGQITSDGPDETQGTADDIVVDLN